MSDIWTDEEIHTRCPAPGQLEESHIAANADRASKDAEIARLKEALEELQRVVEGSCMVERIHADMAEGGHLEIVASHPIVASLASEMARMLSDGPGNHVTMSAHAPDGNTYSVTVQKEGGKTPAERIEELEAEISRLSSLLEQAREMAQELSDEFEAKGRRILTERMESEGLLWLGYSARLLALAAHPAHKEQGEDNAATTPSPAATPVEEKANELGSTEGDQSGRERTDRLEAPTSKSEREEQVVEGSSEESDAEVLTSPASPVCRWTLTGASTTGTAIWDAACGAIGYGEAPRGDCPNCHRPITTDREEG